MLALLTLVVGALGGIGSSIVLHEAYADALGEITVPVPAEGVVFRGSGGRPILRIRAEVGGGSLEVLDAGGRIAARLRATPSGGAIDLSPSSPVRSAMASDRCSEDPGY